MGAGKLVSFSHAPCWCLRVVLEAIRSLYVVLGEVVQTPGVGVHAVPQTLPRSRTLDLDGYLVGSWFNG